eukprot:1193379-Prymnesium_polylepis.1
MGSSDSHYHAVDVTGHRSAGEPIGQQLGSGQDFRVPQLPVALAAGLACGLRCGVVVRQGPLWARMLERTLDRARVWCLRTQASCES